LKGKLWQVAPLGEVDICYVNSFQYFVMSFARYNTSVFGFSKCCLLLFRKWFIFAVCVVEIFHSKYGTVYETRDCSRDKATSVCYSIIYLVFRNWQHL